MNTAKSILVVENEALPRAALVTLLQRAGYPACGAADGGEALERARGLLDPPGLILLDLFMPGVDGWRFRDEQLRQPDLAGIPLVVCSGAEDVERQAGALGAVDCLAKPIDPDALLGLVRRLVGEGSEGATVSGEGGDRTWLATERPHRFRGPAHSLGGLPTAGGCATGDGGPTEA